MRLIASAVAAILLSATMSALAGDNNEISLRQESPVGTTYGNTLSIDQSSAFGSSLKGIGATLLVDAASDVTAALAGNDPLIATQRGEGNAATLKLMGSGGQLELFQSSGAAAGWVPGGAFGKNTAEVTASGYSLGGIIQIGSLNEATLTLDNSQGLITQLGNELVASLNVESGGTGKVVQIGNNSTVGALNVATGTSVTYTQIGDNLQPSAAIAVYSTNAANLTITQTAW